MFTVLMSVYNGDKPEFLIEAFESLRNQSLLAPEIVLVIDGPISVDLNNIIRGYHKLLPLKIIILEANKGLGYALNLGLKFASNEIIFRFDSDDVCVVDRFKKQLEFFLNNNCDLLGSQIKEFNKIIADASRSRVVPCNGNKIYAGAKWRNPFNHMTVVYKKSKVLELGGYPLIPFMEDYALWVKLITNKCCVRNMSEILVFVRAGDGLIRRRSGLKYIYSEFLLQRFMFRLDFISIYEASLHFLIRSMIFMLPFEIKKSFYFYFLRKLIK